MKMTTVIAKCRQCGKGFSFLLEQAQELAIYHTPNQFAKREQPLCPACGAL